MESLNYGSRVEAKMLRAQRREEKRRDNFFRSKPIKQPRRKRSR